MATNTNAATIDTSSPRISTITRSIGYSGKTAAFAKGWIARITGMDSTYGFAREFLRPTTSDRNPRKAKQEWTETYSIPREAGAVYERKCGETTQYFRFTGDLRWEKIDKSEVAGFVA